jgi:UDP-3-O-[3-hydroxymyristoyl] glucosamine N-acyltransferase
MKKFQTSLFLEELQKEIPGKWYQRFDTTITNAAELAEANVQSVCFFENMNYLQQAKQTKAGLLFVPLDFDVLSNPDTNLVAVENPYFCFMLLIKKWLELDSKTEIPKIHHTAIIDHTAEIGEHVTIGANVVIEEKVIIGKNSTIEANCVIKKNVEIGKSVHFYPNVTVYQDCLLGSNVILHSGCVIGADGFGYHFLNNQQIKIPQIGNVVIGDNVEIGANTTIDRATLSSTIIEEGTKIDNLVQIGHNCKIGKHSILCAQVGLAGNTEVGNQVFLAGQVGVAGHLKIGDGAMVGAQSGVAKSIPDGGKYFGTPAVEANLQKRIFASQLNLPTMMKEWRSFKKTRDEK